MKKDQLQDKYDKVFQDIKEEKMDWSFEDFLQKAEGTEPEQSVTPIIPLEEKKKPSFPKWFWMAASVMLVFGIGLFLNSRDSGADVLDQEKLVKDEVLRQKSSFIEENKRSRSTSSSESYRFYFRNKKRFDLSGKPCC